MATLAPSILSADFSRLGADVAAIEQGGADYIHMDIMDGSFVPNITFGVPVVKSLVGKTGLPFDIHLMIDHPDDILEEFVTPQTEYIVVHQEACRHLHRTVQHIKGLGCKAGVALNPATPLIMLEDILPDVDLVLLMTVNPGFGGQKYIPQMTEKIQQLAAIKKAKGLDFVIEIDGGVKLSNVAELKAVGAEMFVAGSAVFGAEDVPARCEEFQKILKEE